MTRYSVAILVRVDNLQIDTPVTVGTLSTRLNVEGNDDLAQTVESAMEIAPPAAEWDRY